MLLAFALGLIFAAASLAAQTKGAPCGDLLAELSKKPQNVEFISCSQELDAQTKPFRANYRLPGKHAAAVEDYLVRNFHMKRLKKSCCQWDGPAGYINVGRSHYEVTMVGEDTVEAPTSRRADWYKVPYFYLQVDLDTQAP